ncbi:uncharacterized protein LOC111701887 [Eurytemora carolleeae]|uniref:uncharacterized protein LOC111701887 n=1 Tax=Eurytemora carolleeae TaxID=1294199 RepID=UPI000C757B54|nr:uncharacterized protein LOC111701887 [Eurytemora carolleeae]|eukprot:XP_023329135.1 uncharacterized protein LOC111701887 [Eurytemora affinis]
MILLTNLPMLTSTWKNRVTILDSLLTLECFNSFCHCYLIINTIHLHLSYEPYYCYFQILVTEIVGNMDRIIPFSVAFYRFCLVTLSTSFYRAEDRYWLGNCLWILIVCTSTLSTVTGYFMMENNRIYFECVGKLEDFYFIKNGYLTDSKIYNKTSGLNYLMTGVVVATVISVPVFYITIMVYRFNKDR